METDTAFSCRLQGTITLTIFRVSVVGIGGVQLNREQLNDFVGGAKGIESLKIRAQNSHQFTLIGIRGNPALGVKVIPLANTGEDIATRIGCELKEANIEPTLGRLAWIFVKFDSRGLAVSCGRILARNIFGSAGVGRGE